MVEGERARLDWFLERENVVKPRERELELVAERGKGLLRDFHYVSLFFLLIFFAKDF